MLFLTRWFGVTGGDSERNLAAEKSDIEEIVEKVLLMQADAAASQSAATTGGGAAGGALIGGIAGGGKGAGIGALLGAGVGLVGGAFTGNNQIELPAETILTFALTQPLTLK